jgi:hypothetical protein
MPIAPGALLAVALELLFGFAYAFYVAKVGDGGAYMAEKTVEAVFVRLHPSPAQAELAAPMSSCILRQSSCVCRCSGKHSVSTNLRVISSQSPRPLV